jgi:tRNA A37 methylthiotransferase MiaB
MRRNTAAARMIDNGMAVDSQEISRRAKLLRELSQIKLTESLMKKVGTVQEVLVEEKTVTLGSRVCSTGHSRNFHKVVVPGKHTRNQLKRVKIVGFEKDFLKGELL